MLTNDDRMQLLSFRLKHDINQHQFSKGIISRNQLSNIENGKSDTTEKVLYALVVRLYEYMMTLKDYQRIHFESLKHFGFYQNFEKALDIFERLGHEEPSTEDVNEMNLWLNHHYHGMINALTFERLGDCFMRQEELDNAFLFYQKAYYSMATAHIDDINVGYVAEFMVKVARLGMSLQKTFSVTEILEHLDFLLNQMPEVRVNRDYLYDLALSYEKMDLSDKALEIAKRIEFMNFNEQMIGTKAVGMTFHLMGNLYHVAGAKELGRKYHDKAHRILDGLSAEEALNALKLDVIKYSA